MRDELFDRDFQHGREALNDGIDGLLVRAAAFIRDTGEVTHRVLWSAPWKAATKRKPTGIA